MSGLAQDFLDDRIMIPRPINLFGKRPEIDDVPDEIEFLALVVFEEIQQDIGLALRGADMQIGNPDGSIRMASHNLLNSAAAMR